MTALPHLSDLKKAATTLQAARKILRELMREDAPHAPVSLTPARRSLWALFQKKISPFEIKPGEAEVWFSAVRDRHPAPFADKLHGENKTSDIKKSA